MNKHNRARIRIRLLFNNHSLKFGCGDDVPKIKHYYDDNIEYINECEAAEKELKRLQNKEVGMKPVVDNDQPYCPICKVDLYYGRGIMDKYTDYYCSKCGQKIDWSDEK